MSYPGALEKLFGGIHLGCGSYQKFLSTFERLLPKLPTDDAQTSLGLLWAIYFTAHGEHITDRTATGRFLRPTYSEFIHAFLEHRALWKAVFARVIADALEANAGITVHRSSMRGTLFDFTIWWISSCLRLTRAHLWERKPFALQQWIRAGFFDALEQGFPRCVTHASTMGA